MGKVFGYDSLDIEAQYKQDRYLKEAEQDRFINQINMKNKEPKIPDNKIRLRGSIWRLWLSHSPLHGSQ